MNTSSVKGVALAGLLLVIGLGCKNSSSGSASSPGSGGSSGVANAAAVDRIVQTRCEREVACNNVGPGKHWQDKDACAREMSHDTGTTLRPEECPGGVSSKDLEECVK